MAIKKKKKATKWPNKFKYSPMGFKGKLSKYFFSNGITYFFLVILIEIFILKTTMYHKYRLKYQKFTKKNVKKTLLSSMFKAVSILTGQDTGCIAKFLSVPFHSNLSFKNIGTSIERRFIQK
jgi:hypothetical protein